MTRLSVNINKFATLRNARGGNNPDVKFWIDLTYIDDGILNKGGLLLLCDCSDTLRIQGFSNAD